MKLPGSGSGYFVNWMDRNLRGIVLATFQALMQPVPDRAQLAGQKRRLSVHATVDPDELAAWLVEHGFQRADAVEVPGEFSRRGGIFDVYSPDAEAPVPAGIFGDEIESIRQFSAADAAQLGQRGDGGVDGHLEARRRPAAGFRPFHRLPAGRSWTALIEPGDLDEQGKHYIERVADARGLFSVPDAPATAAVAECVHQRFAEPSVETTCHLRVESVERFSGDIAKLRGELDAAAPGDRVLIALPQ